MAPFAAACVPTVVIRPIAATDRPQWAQLWEAYLAFYETSVSEAVYASSFDRLIDPDVRDYNGLVAEKDGQLIGLTHYIFHRHGWKIEDVCYLQDLYTAPDSRGTGVGRKLIEGVYAAADAAGMPTVYWMTDATNSVARRLYDRIATLTPFIKYQRVMS